MNTYTIDDFEITSPDPLTEEEQRQVLEMYKKDQDRVNLILIVKILF